MIDTALHQWALDNGYVRLADITEFVRHQSEPNSQQVVELLGKSIAMEGRVVEIAHVAIDTAADLFVQPEITLEDILGGLRDVMGRHPQPEQGAVGKKFLARFGAERASDFMGALKDKRREFLEAAKEYAA